MSEKTCHNHQGSSRTIRDSLEKILAKTNALKKMLPNALTLK